jgi:PAS domain S-box-containing protein
MALLRHRVLKVTRNRATKKVLITTALAVVVFLAGWLTTGLVAGRLRERDIETRGREVSGVAAAVDYRKVESLEGGPADEGSADYQRLSEQLLTIQKSNTQVSGMELLGLRGGALVYLACGSDRGGPAFKRPGDISDIQDPAIVAALSGAAPAEPVVREDVREGTGVFVRATAYVRDRDGKPVAWLIVDVPRSTAMVWINALAVAGHVATGILTLAVALMGALWIGIGQSLDRRKAGQRQAEEELVEAGERWKRSFEAVAIGMFVLDPEFTILQCNSSFAELIGSSADSVVGRKCYSVVHGLESAPESCATREAVLRGKSASCELFDERLGKHLLLSADPVFELDGTVDYVIHFAKDITERKQAEDELRESEERYRQIFENASEGIFQSTPEGTFLSVNPAFARMYGYDSPEQMIREVTDISSQLYADPADREEIKRLLAENGFIRGMEVRYRCRDGSPLWVVADAHVVRDSEGNVLCFEGTTADITERKQLQERLERVNKTVLSQSVDPDANIGNMVMCCRDIFDGAMAKYTGYRHGKEVTFTVLREMDEYTQAARAEGRYRYEDVLGNGHRALVVGNIDASPYADLDPDIKKHRFNSLIAHKVKSTGEHTGSLCVFDSERRDFAADEVEILGMLAMAISVEEERRAREEELRDFISIASHELRHPASLFKGYSTILLEDGEELDEQTRRHALRAIDRAADRMARLIGELLDTAGIDSGRVVPDLEEVDPASLAGRAIEEMRARGSDVDFDVGGPQSCDSILCDPERVKDVLTILLDNAVKYSPPGSEVDVRWERVGDEVVFRVADRGPGIRESDRELVFNRFYQIELVEHHSLPGMGLGLYIAKAYVEAHGGWIRCEERGGGGSTFSFGIPSPGG